MKLSGKDCTNSDEAKVEMTKVSYAFVVGCLMYTMIGTHPNMAFVVRVVCRYMANLGKKHWEAIKRVIRYLKSTKNMCTCYGS